MLEGWELRGPQEGGKLGLPGGSVELTGNESREGRQVPFRWSAIGLGLRLGNWIWRLGRRMKINSLIPWLLVSGVHGESACIADERNWGMGLGRKAVGEALLSSLGMGAGRKESPQQVVYYRAGDKTGELGLEGGKENEDNLPVSLASMARGFPERQPRMLRWVRQADGVRKEGRLWIRISLASFPFNAKTS